MEGFSLKVYSYKKMEFLQTCQIATKVAFFLVLILDEARRKRRVYN